MLHLAFVFLAGMSSIGGAAPTEGSRNGNGVSPVSSTPSSVLLVQDGIHDAVLTETPDSAYEIVTSGDDPCVYAAPFENKPDLSKYSVLSFEYFTTTPTRTVQVYFTPPAAEERSITGEGLGHSEGWVTYTRSALPRPLCRHRHTPA